MSWYAFCAAERALGKKQLDEAVAYFEQAIAAAPTDVRGYSGLGRTYLQRNEIDKAIGIFKQGIEHNRGGDTFDLQLLLLGTLLADARLTDANEVLDSLDAQIASLASRNVLQRNVPETMIRRSSMVDASRTMAFRTRGIRSRRGFLDDHSPPARESVKRRRKIPLAARRTFVSLGRCYLKLGIGTRRRQRLPRPPRCGLSVESSRCRILGGGQILVRVDSDIDATVGDGVP